MENYVGTWYICYENDPNPDPNPDTDPNPDPLKFTPEQQEHINKIIAKEKREQQDKTKKALDEVEALRKKSKLTTKEKEEYEKKVNDLRKSLMSKEELAKDDREKMINDYEKKLLDSTTNGKKWEHLYHDSTIKRAITDAAVVNKAFNPEQIVAMLRQTTQLIEETNEEGKPTGKLIPEVEFSTYDKEKNPVTLKLPVGKAIEKMKEDERYANLFVGDGTPGLGDINRGGKGGAGDVDLVELAKNPAAFEKARREGKLDSVLGEQTH